MSLLFIAFLWLYKESGFLIIIGLYAGVPILLQIILHLNYLIHDRKVLLSVNIEDKEIIYKNCGREIHIKFQDIKSITRFQGSKHPKPFEAYTIPSNFYHYTMIESNNGEIILFSDFICSEIGIYQPKKGLQIRPFLNLLTKTAANS